MKINLLSNEQLLSCSYNPNLTLLNNHIQSISRSLDFYSSKYNNFFDLGYFNDETSNTTFSEFCARYNLKNLIKEPTCFKSLENRICIDLILTNWPKYFQNSNIFETGLFDFHKSTFIILKAQRNLRQSETIYRLQNISLSHELLSSRDPVRTLCVQEARAFMMVDIKLRNVNIQ